MPQTFVIDQAATFTGVAFLKAIPKTVFGKPDEQDRTPDGRLKWDVQLVAGFRDQFGGDQHEVIKVNVASNVDPGQGLGQYTPVQLVNFVVGVVPPEVRKDNRGGEKLVGGTTWYRADEVRPLNAKATRTNPES
ncbi:hypothetical protein AB0H00_31775 [Nocardia sp. NPDC023852]|uniref:hypothetical protein n=1 Tax=Actinomycetes TaxID=1760 RepID=UPI0033EF24CB